MRGVYVIFGAGERGKEFLSFVGEDSVSFFIDNDKTKKIYSNTPIYEIADGLSRIKNEKIVIAVGENYRNDIKQQLIKLGVENFLIDEDEKRTVIKRKISERNDYIAIYRRAIGWVVQNTVDGEGIICHSNNRKSYPEVTGYYIPSLLQWGYRDLAIQYAKWLSSIQKEDGSWYDVTDKEPYVFDTGQIIKGLLAVRELIPEVKSNIIRGCNWLLSNMTAAGRLKSPRDNDFGDGKTYSELIHLYCLSPLVNASEAYNMPEYKEKAYQILEYYKNNYRKEITNFDLLSHFYAYVMEGLLDMGERELVIESMRELEDLQGEDGSIPAYNNVHWVCSTGMFQLSLVWFRIGDDSRGTQSFNYACRLQNETGGWYGGYPSTEENREYVSYFPNSEISWAIKYFLDALHWKNKRQFEKQSSLFKSSLPLCDGRYRVITELVSESIQNKKRLFQNGYDVLKVIDVGCGKGAYIKNLIKEYPDIYVTAIDISESVMNYIEDDVDKRFGSLTSIPAEDGFYDVTYACESLEHAVDIPSSIREMARVTKSGGLIAIIDKNKKKLGEMEIEEWEQWFDIGDLTSLMKKFCSHVSVRENISYERPADGLFCAWIGIVK